MKLICKASIASMMLMTGMNSTPLEAILASVKSVGMAQACVAYPLDSLGAAYNPASMAWVGNRLDGGVHLAYTPATSTIKGNLVPGVDGKYRVNGPFAWIPEGGMSYQMKHMGVGFVSFNEDNLTATYDKALRILGTSKLKGEFELAFIAPTFAVCLPYGNTIGIGINFAIQRARAQGIENFDNAMASVHPGAVTNNHYNYSTGIGFSIGWRLDITPNLRLGVVYQPKTHMNKFTKYEGFLVDGSIDVPENARFGISYTFKCITAAFDVNYVGYSGVPAIHNSIDQFSSGHLAGSSAGPGFGWDDQWYFRLGFDWKVSETISVRTGFRHANVPFNAHNTALNFVTVNTIQDYLCCGGSWKFTENLEFSGYYCYGVDHAVKGRNSLPVNFGGGEVNLRSSQQLVGLAMAILY